MTSSSSSSDGLAALALACALFLALFPATGEAAPVTQVRVPVSAFGRKSAEPLLGSVWKAAQPSQLTQFRGVLLAPPPGFGREAFKALAEELSAAGFDVLLLEPRKADKQLHKTLIEDIQSGVAFMKTDRSVGVVKVLIVAAAQSASAAAEYASASRQMSMVLDGLVLLGPPLSVGPVKLAAALRSIDKIHVLLTSSRPDVLSLASECPAWCKALKSPDSERSIIAKKDIVEFLLKPHG